MKEFLPEAAVIVFMLLMFRLVSLKVYNDIEERAICRKEILQECYAFGGSAYQCRIQAKEACR